jgi:SSS family solute:Na+ symporter
MKLSLLDWSAVVAYLLITLFMGLYFRRRSGKSVDDYFVSGRNVSWWLSGTSMVATTFAADTPLVVTGLVYTQGIAGNWLWWAFLLSGMMTVFLFARLWRRSGLITDVQFAELRYAGKPAAFLRGFRAIYLGMLMNCLILGWVTKAMISITAVVLGVSNSTALIICVLILIPFTGFYVSIGGLWGVLWTDLFQFVLKMGVVISIAYFAVRAVGGMGAMVDKLTALHAANPGSANPLKFLPDFSRPITDEPLWTLPVLSLMVNLGVQWWAFWYPGAEPGGGGYIAQRIFSARDEKQGLLAVLWFNVAHYAVRPWPWIITALAAILLYPGLQAGTAHPPESGYMLVLTNQLPPALRGLAIAGFLAAFMSTIATQLNWGASYLVSDFYRRFIKQGASEKHYVNASRVATVILVIAAALVAAQLSSIKSGWQVVLETGAGTGLVYILRWYWWRINAWSEISAMIAALTSTLAIHLVKPFSGSDTVVGAKGALTTTAITTLVWLVTTFATRPEPQETLLKFYRKVRPEFAGWKSIAAQAPEIPVTHEVGRDLISWMLGCVMVYAALFGTGKLIFMQYSKGALLLLVAVISAGLLYRRISAIPSVASGGPDEPAVLTH